MKLRLPYGDTYIEYDAAGAQVLCAYEDASASGLPGIELVRRAMQRPYGGGTLYELARGKRNAVIIVSDHTRPVPSRDIIPPMLEELRRAEPDIAITLLVATGFHRKTTREELIAKLGREIVEHERIAVHDSADASGNIEIGVLPSGAPLCISRIAAEAELLCSEGFIEPHFFAGFSGGRKSVLPGVCDRMTVLGNHRSEFIDHPCARAGVLDENPIHRDMLAAARMARLSYIVNVVLDADKRTAAAFAGEPEAAHRAGCEYLMERCAVTAVPCDIVITTNGGAPLDQNIYQCVKSLTAAESAATEDGVLIVCAQCADGTGGDAFYRSVRDAKSPAALYEGIMATKWDATVPDQWESQILARVLMHHEVIFVTERKHSETVRNMKLKYALSLEAALAMARARKGEGASVCVIPDGVSVIVRRACRADDCQAPTDAR